MESEGKGFEGQLYQLEQSQKPVGLEDLTERISSDLRKYLPDGLSDFFETIVVDLRNCAINRVISGMENNFYNELFMIYQSGGVPCGWNGNYPEGQLIAYYEANREPDRRRNE